MQNEGRYCALIIGALLDLAEALCAMWRDRKLRLCLAVPCPWAGTCFSTPQPVCF